MMKKYIQLVVASLFSLSSFSFSLAQDHPYKGSISVEPVRFEQQGDALFVDMNIILEGVKMNSTKSLDIIPQLTSPTQPYTQTLPKISLKGSNGYKVYERKLALMSKQERKEYKAPFLLEKVDKEMSDILQYRYILPYEAWMSDARLDIYYDVCGCGEETSFVESIVEKVTLEQPDPYVVTPHLAYIQPKAEAVKRREIQMECFLDFEVNKVNIRTEYMNNPRELAKIRGMIDDLKNDPSISVNRLDIIGYASPEGSLVGNKRLSEGRAKALRDYLAGRYEFPRNIYHIEFGGENWTGLVESLQNYEMDSRDDVLAILRNTVDSEQRKQRLKNLHGGAPYRQMLKDIYPSLRVAICKVDYSIKNFDIDEAKEVIKRRPQNLSLNEMFLVANTYPKGSQDFIDVFETAVKMFPEDEVANLNAAAAALDRKNIAYAERYIERVESKNYPAEYNNIKGLIAILKENYEEAEIYLKKSADRGLEEAKLNLIELTNKKNEQTKQIF